MDKPQLDSVKLFFRTFEKHLMKMREEGADDALSYRAQILLRQLELFEKAVLERPAGESGTSWEAGALRQLMAAKDFNQLIEWAVAQRELFPASGVFYLNAGGAWERLAGEAEPPRRFQVDEWIQRGALGRIGFGAYAVYLFGEPRLAVVFDEEAAPESALELLRFLARQLALVAEPLPDGNRRNRAGRSGIIARNPAFIALLDLAETAAAKDITILLEGESGTGKEVLANFIHEKSARGDKPFVPVNCAAIPAGLIESELFGHEKGAFTGAYQRQIGKVEQANGGTLFLDEIGEMELSMQAKLLRFLQLREFHRIGGRNKVSVDIRVIAATNRNLKKQMADRLFREDLYYRLSAMPIVVPPLRDRVDDIAPLARHFIKTYSRSFGRRPPTVEPMVFHLLAAHRFPGNVRELENLVQKMLVLAKNDRITADLLPELMRPAKPNGAAVQDRRLPTVWRKKGVRVSRFRLSTPGGPDGVEMSWRVKTPKTNQELKALKQDISDFAKDETLGLERRFLDDLLARAGGSMPEASRLAKINRTLLYKMLDRAKEET